MDADLVPVSEAGGLTGVLQRGALTEIIVPFTRMADLQLFLGTAHEVLVPEDRDAGIIYFANGWTPDDWTGLPDPRPYGNPTLRTVCWNRNFSELEATLEHWQVLSRMAPTPRRRLSIVAAPGFTLSNEHERLLRAAFRDCHEIIVSSGRQGYSGSALMRVQPTGPDGGDLPDRMAKAFPNARAAAETAHFESHLAQQLDPQDYVTPDPLRTVVGEGRSMLVTRLVPGRNGEIVTLLDLFSDRPALVLPVIQELGQVLLRTFKTAKVTDESIAKSYLSGIRPELETRLLEELDLMKWIGVSEAPDRLQAFVAWLDSHAGRASRVAEVHGDLHAGNIAIKENGDAKPVLIDFAHSAKTHAIADLAALAADIIVRVIGKTSGPDQQLAAVQALLDKDVSSSTHEQAILALRDLAKQHLSCERREFAGAMLCRILWIIPRASEADDRKNLRNAADALFRTLSV